MPLPSLVKARVALHQEVAGVAVEVEAVGIQLEVAGAGVAGEMEAVGIQRHQRHRKKGLPLPVRQMRLGRQRP